MRRFFIQMFAALALVVSGSIIAVTPAHAAVSSPASVSTESSSKVVTSAPNVYIAKVEPKTATSIPKVYGGGIKPVWLYVSCYYAVDGWYWCWRYACTSWEYWLQGCRDGWYRAYQRVWYA